MNIYTLRQGVLNDDELFIPEEGKLFKGGYIAIVEYHRYLNAWNNTHHVKRFRNRNQLIKYLDKNYTSEELECIEV